MLLPIGTDAPLRYPPITTGILIAVNIACFVVQHWNSKPLVLNEPGNWQPVSASMVQDFDGFNLDEEPDKDAPQWDSGEVDLDDWDDFKGDDEAEEGQFITLTDAIGGPKEQGWRKHTLWIGDGLHPTQWLTSFFIHMDIWRLLGNMFFLALFGIIVEGRMGSWQFAVYYLAVGIAGAFITQLLLLKAGQTVCLGASAAIYGIMVTAGIWSPRANVICLFLIFFRAYFPRIPLLIFAAFYFLTDLGFTLFSNGLVDTPFLHVLGGVTGAILSLVVLKKHWVDTEYQDLISILIEVAGKDPRKVNKRPLTKKEVQEKETEKQEKRITREQHLENIWRSVDVHLTANNLDAAIAMGRKGTMMDPKSGWEEDRLLRLIGKLQLEKLWKDVIEFSNLYLETYTEREAAIRINLAKIYVVQKRLPRRALKTIKPLKSKTLTDEQAETIRKIIAEAKKLIAEGVLELSD